MTSQKKFRWIIFSITLSALLAGVGGRLLGLSRAAAQGSAKPRQQGERVSRAESARPESVARKFAELRAKAEQNGKLRVIVGLRADFEPEGSLSDESQQQRQRAGISQAQDDLLSRLKGYNQASVAKFESIPFVALEVDAEVLRLLREDMDVATIEEDTLMRPALAESTQIVGATAAWARGFSGAGQTVAILDTGVDKNHSFLAGKVVSEACYSTNFTDPNGDTFTSLCPGGVSSSTAPNSGLNCAANVDGCNHGTHVAGIAAGRGGGFSGVARDANVIAIQVFSRADSQAVCGGNAPCTVAFTSDVIRGLERVAALRNSLNIAAANLSLGGGRYFSNCDADNPATTAAVSNLRSMGIAPVISSGNDGFTNAMGSPACISSAISVGSTSDGSSTTALDVVSSFSNSAAFLSLLAPGDLITSSVPGGQFSNLRGTSMAAPHVAGAWAVLKSAVPSADVTQTLGALTATGAPIRDTRNQIVKSRIRVDAAINSLMGGGCSYLISPASQAFTAAGGNGAVSVTAAGNCSWQATSNIPWATINSGGNGAGNGTVGFTVQANITSGSRTGTLTIAGQSFTVSQAAINSDQCNFPPPITVGQQINGTLSADDCQFPSGFYVDFYSFNGTGGQQIAVNLDSTALDAYLILIGPSGATIAENNNGGGGTSARIPAGIGFLPLPETGVYKIVAASFFRGEVGNYSLRLVGQNPGGGNAVSLVNKVPHPQLLPAGFGMLSATQFLIEVPPGAGQLVVTLDGGKDVDLFVRFGQRVEQRSNGLVIADQQAISASGNETIVVNQFSQPPIRSGFYFIGVANYSATASTVSIVAGYDPLPNGSPVELAVDDGFFETETSIFQGGTSYVVNRLTPPAYPATLSAVKLSFPSRGNVPIGTDFFIMVGVNPNGGENIDRTSFQLITAKVAALDQYVTYSVPQITIAGGDFVVGYRITARTGIQPFSLDQSPPSRRRSYYSTNSTVFTVVDDNDFSTRGNLAIRAIALTTGGAACTYGITPASQGFGSGGGNGAVNVATQAGCNWTAASNASFITINSGASGAGNGAVSFNVAANSAAASRTGTLTVAGQTFTVTQDAAAGCSYSVSPANQSFTVAGGTGSVNVTAAGGCNWTAASNVGWINVTSGASGSGNGAASYSVQPNGDSNQRTGTLTVAGQTVTVLQAGVVVTGGRTLRAVDASGAPGGQVTVPVELNSQGDENALGFSLTFDPATLGNPQAMLGSDATGARLTSNAAQAGQGRFGLVLSLDAGQRFPAGARRIATVTFTVAAGAGAASTQIGFGDQPIFREVVDVNARSLTTAYVPGAVTLQQGFEADLTPRPNGDGRLTVGDLVQAGRFVAGLDAVESGGEFQRADCAPRDMLGDGRLTVSDLVQAGRYVAGLDAQVSAGGPTAPVGFAPGLNGVAGDRGGSEQARVLRIAGANIARGQNGTVIVELDAQGNENAFGFSLGFDPAQLRFVSAALGKDAPAGSLFQVNANQAASSRLGVVLALETGKTLAAGAQQIVVVTFAALAGGNGAATNLSFGDQPVAREVTDASARALTASYNGGTVSFIRAVATVSAASFGGARLAAEMIVAAFGSQLATGVVIADTVPLPTTLASTTIKITDSAGIERAAPLFFVAPTQINYQIPAGVASGVAAVTVTSGDGAVSTGQLNIGSVAPGLFSANSSGQGVVAAVALRLAPDGTQTFAPVAGRDPAGNVVSIPVDLGSPADQVFLILYGTGWRSRSSLAAVTATIGGASAEVFYAGLTPGFIGLDQINLRLPRDLMGRGEVDIALTIDGVTANIVRVNVK